MSLNFLPAGLPISSSFAVSASVTTNTTTFPLTASFAEFSITNFGPTGSYFVTVTGSLV